MRNFIIIPLVVILLSLSSIPLSSAADLMKGSEAYGKGDYETAFKEWHPLAEQGLAEAQYFLGGMYHFGDGVAQDHFQAVHWFRKAAEQGNANAQYFLGGMYLRGQGVAQDDFQAVHWFRKAAEQGNANAQYALGLMYGNGDGVTQDFAKATEWIQKAAEQGQKEAQDTIRRLNELNE